MNILDNIDFRKGLRDAGLPPENLPDSINMQLDRREYSLILWALTRVPAGYVNDAANTAVVMVRAIKRERDRA